MFCSKCGKEQLEGAKFCGQCGQEVGKPVSPSPTTSRTPQQKSGLEDFAAMAAKAASDSVQSQTRSQISRAVSDVFRGIFKR
jgi:uncharacterized membrane protein YvbJ